MDEVIERLERFLDRRFRIRKMHLVQIDPFGAQPAQARLDRESDPAARRAALRPRVAHRPTELGRDHGAVAPALERRAENLLARAATIDVRGVEEVHTRIECRMHDPRGAARIETAAEVVAADADDGDAETRGAQSP